MQFFQTPNKSDPCYYLVGLICYVRTHYVCYIKSEREGGGGFVWKLYNDDNQIEVFQSWHDVLSQMIEC